MTIFPDQDPLGALLPGSRLARKGTPGGPLSGMTFLAKDIYDLAGATTGCGNPDWARTHAPAPCDAWAVAKLLDAGAELTGKTITDELAYSLNGQNFHYGTPTNPNAPGRIPGGSSSGSASAVAGGLSDTALGSDTGGSIRIPASYCGLFGLRPTHGRLPLTGVMPLAPSFDTVGWFARDPQTLKRVGETLFEESACDAPEPQRLLIAEDCFELLPAPIAARFTRELEALSRRFAKVERVRLADPTGFHELMITFRLIQALEIQEQHRNWIEDTKPAFGPEIAERFTWALSISLEEKEPRDAIRNAFTQRLEELVGDNALVCLPSAPGIAPKLSATAEDLVQHRTNVLSLTCLSGLSRMPQISLPLVQHDGCPLGLSLMAPRDGDMTLLTLAVELAPESAVPGAAYAPL